TRRLPGTPIRVTSTAHQVPTRTRSRTPRSSRRTAPTSSRASTSCAPCAASTPASPPAFTCIWATPSCSKRSTSPSSTSSSRETKVAQGMVDSAGVREYRQQMERVETLIQELERLPDPRARAHTREILQSILDLHGRALETILEAIAETGETGLAM